MKLKKIIALAMVTCVMLTSVACSSGDTTKETEKTTTATEAETKSEESEAEDTTESAANGEQAYSGKKLTVGIWGGNDAESAAIEQVKADFEALTGASVELKVYTDYNTQIQADFIGGTAPDVFYIDGSMFSVYSELGVMEPLDAEEMGADAYYENLLGAFTAEDGTIYCIPKDVSTLATYVNVDILESVGVSVSDIPTALEDYQEFLVNLQAKLDEEYGKNQIAAMTYNQDLARNLYILDSGASIIDEDGYATLSDAAVVENVQFIVDMATAGAWKTPSDLGLGWNGEAFGVGKAAIMEEGNWVYGTLEQDYSDINYTVIEMPTYKGTQYSMAFTVGYGVYAKSAETELAKEWIKYATGIDGMTTWCNGAGTLPSRADVAEAMDVESDVVLAVHLVMAEIATPWQRGSTVSIVNTAFQNFFPLAVSGDATVQDAMEQADAQANSEIENSR